MSKLTIHPHYALSFLNLDLISPEPNRLADYYANGDYDLADYEIVGTDRYQLDHQWEIDNLHKLCGLCGVELKFNELPDEICTSCKGDELAWSWEH